MLEKGGYLEIINSRKIKVSLAPWDFTQPICAIRFLVLWRDKFRCIYCDAYLTNENDVIDHVISESDLGPTSCDNLAACCCDCNLKKGNAILSVEELRRVVLKTRINSEDLQKITGVIVPSVTERITPHERINPKNCPTCDVCGKAMRIQHGKYGFFWSCPDYKRACGGRTKNLVDPEVMNQIEFYYP